MIITIGESIKRLRKMKEMTQEELALSLGISFQAISKWEKGETYPDITMLPALSNFFEVTVDELIGMNQIGKQEDLSQIFTTIHILEAENKYEEAIQLIRNALKTYPNNYSLMSELALALSFSNENTKATNSMKEEAIELSERVLANSTNEKVKSTTKVNLCFLYNDIGNNRKAQNLVRTLPHIWESREMMLMEFLSDEKYIEALTTTINTVLSMLHSKIDNINNRENLMSVTKNMITLGCPQINAETFDNKREKFNKIIDFLKLQN